VAVLGAVVDKEQQARCGQALDKAIEQGLGLSVDPMQVLEDQEERSLARFAYQQLPDRVECATH
jgi:hypothetical protein